MEWLGFLAGIDHQEYKMKLTKNLLKKLIKEELEEAYQPLSQSSANLEANPGAAIDHLDSGLSSLDGDLDSLMQDIDRLDNRFDNLKGILFKITAQMKKGKSAASQDVEEPMVDADFKEDPSLAERLMEKLTSADKKRKKELEDELDTIQHK